MYKKYNKNFWILFTGQSISNLGDQIYLITLPILVYELTKSSFIMGTVSAVNIIPELLFALFIGAVVDRYKKKKIMLYTAILEMIIMLSLSFLYSFNLLKMEIIYIFGFIFSTLILVFLTTYRSTIPLLVSKEQIITVNSIIQISLTIIKIIGPGLAGFLIFQFNIAIALLLNSISFLILSIFIYFTQIDEKHNFKSNKSIVEDITEGINEIKRNKSISYITLLALFVNIGMSIGFSLLIFHLKENFNFSEKSIGLIYSVSGIFAFIFSFASTYISNLCKNNILLITLSTLFAGLGLIIISWAYNLLLISIALGVITGGATLATIYINSELQLVTPPNLIGRVFATVQMISRISLPISLILGGWLSSFDSIGTSGTFFMCGLSIVLLSVYGINKLRRFSNEYTK